MKTIRFIILSLAFALGLSYGARAQVVVTDPGMVATSIENAASAAADAASNVDAIFGIGDKFDNMINQWFGLEKADALRQGAEKALKYGSTALDFGHDLGYLENLVRESNRQRKALDDLDMVFNMNGGYGTYGLRDWTYRMRRYSEQQDRVMTQLKTMLVKYKMPLADQIKLIDNITEEQKKATVKIENTAEIATAVVEGSEEGEQLGEELVAQTSGRSSAAAYSKSEVVKDAGSLASAQGNFWKVLMYISAFLFLATLGWGFFEFFFDLTSGHSRDMNGAYFMRIAIAMLVLTVVFAVLKNKTLIS